ncbi:DNA recombination protein RmuC [Qipengyuania sp. DSG2-2]|uniref:DNA recombination protein RmuC n=1 Tax=Qipengyuania sp. DGS2-2 TaxID=3349631 RepID=UPI0036D40169
METTVIIFVIVALLVGLGAGWFLGSRPVNDWRVRHEERDAEAKKYADDVARMTPELATMSERAGRADTLAEQLDTARSEREALRAEVATLKEKSANFDEQMKLMREAREEMLKEFQNTGNAVLGKAQEAFLERAAERFGHSEKASAEKLQALMKPVDDRLKKYEEQVSALEEKRANAFSALGTQIEQMRLGQEEVRREAQRLGNSLTNAPKARGRWGEQQLKNLLEQVGLAQHTDFELEQSIDTEEGRLRPDAIVRIPGGKMLVIDAKVSLNAYQAAFEADNDEARDLALKAHVASMKNHVQQLGAKSYQSQFEDAPDYVVMFVPGEHFVAAALEHDPELWDFAFDKRVLLATPTNLVAIARTVAQVWRQDALAAEARDIGRLATDLFDRIAIAGEHLKRVGGGLDSAVKNYNKFVGSFERNVLSSARKLKEKGIETGKREAEEVPLVEGTPNYNAEDVAELDALEDKSGDAG